MLDPHPMVRNLAIEDASNEFGETPVPAMGLDQDPLKASKDMQSAALTAP